MRLWWLYLQGEGRKLRPDIAHVRPMTCLFKSVIFDFRFVFSLPRISSGLTTGALSVHGYSRLSKIIL